MPALAVEAQRNSGKDTDLPSILPNCLPLWYWFGELLVPGFVGDRRPDVVAVASNVFGAPGTSDSVGGVRYSVSVEIGSE